MQLSRSLNFTALGVLAVLLDEFPSGTGMLNISQMAKACDVARSTVIAQLRTLEDKGMIVLGPPEKEGRPLKIMCSENATYSENDTCFESATVARGSSSSLLSNLETTTTEQGDSENATLPTFTNLQPWEKMTLRSDAEELFYISLIAKTDVGQFSMQTLRLYKKIYEEKSREHALALFLFLLPRAKDNPTGYILSSYKQGAEPNADSLKRVKEMQEVFECLAKTQSTEDTKQKMQSALDNNDTQKLLMLSQQQEKYKKALSLLSWRSSFEALVEKRGEFVEALLKK
jgi:hypothetical protein